MVVRFLTICILSIQSILLFASTSLEFFFLFASVIEEKCRAKGKQQKRNGEDVASLDWRGH
jgi:hypothetical protein